LTTQQLSGTTAIVTGASRGFGRGAAAALAQAGAHVVGVARDAGALEEVREQLGAAFMPVAADAADPVVAGQLIDEYRPRALVLNAGASPLPRPVHSHTWQTFSRNWEVDVQHAFHWTREALLAPLAPGSTVIAVSSGPRCGVRRYRVAMPEPRPPSGSSPPTPPRNRAGTDSASGSSRCFPT
jgi:NAD(P)-dependent dehydrogenase (short-subunit alcohol dehydrogenase family)